MFMKQVADFRRPVQRIDKSEVPYLLVEHEKEPVNAGGRPQKVRLDDTVSGSSVDGSYGFKTEE